MLSATRFGARDTSRADIVAGMDFAITGGNLRLIGNYSAIGLGGPAVDSATSAYLVARNNAANAAAARVTPPSEPAYNGAGTPSTSMAATGDQRIDGILSGVKWNATSITYSDTDNANDYQAGYNSDGNSNGISAQNEGFSQFSALQMISLHAALNDATYTQLAGAYSFSVEGFTNLSITYNGAGTANSTIRAANSSDPGTSYAYYPNANAYGGDTFIGTSARNPVAGNYSWHTLWHELGHTLGLKHGQETNVYGALPAAYNSLEFSVMTYATYIGDTTGGVDYETWGAPQTFMMLDIAALQAMYGADYSTNSGNTTYSWNPTSGETYVNGVIAIDPGGNRIFMTVWDGGGVDTYDLSNYTSSLEINLDPGGYSDFNSGQSAYLGGGPNGGYARGNVFNALLFGGNTASMIENANGGSGNDTISGNSIANVLRGNGGSDYLYGYGGGDTLYGGDGNDVLVTGGGGNDSAYGEAGDDYVYWGPPTPSTSDVRYMDGGSGTDTIHGGGTVFGAGATFNLGAGTYTNGGSFTETWVNFENYYNYGSGAETVIGSAGNNTIQTGSGNNLIDGGSGDDLIYAGAGNDTIYGGYNEDTIYGQDGDDLIVVRDGEFVDNVDGGTGIDTLDVSAEDQDEIVVNLTTGVWTGSYNPSAVTISNIENVNGTQVDDTITGNSATNVIHGNGGNDTINGGGGSADLLYGDAGNDRIFWGPPNPTAPRTVDGGADIDTIDGGGTFFGTGITWNMAAGTYGWSGFTETWVNFENYWNATGTGNENVIGTSVANMITTGSGTSTLQGGDGDDILDGGAGDDTLDGGNGIDIASYALATAGVTVNVQVSGAQNTGGWGSDTLIGIEGLIGSAYNDVLTGSGTAGGYVRAGDGNDRVYAALGYDDLDGGAGTDTLDTTLWSGAYVVDLATGLTNYSGELMINFENLVSGAGDDTLSGTVGNNLMVGGLGNDIIDGRDGNDTLRGGDGDDVLIGGVGNDSIEGGGGRDTADYSAATAAITLSLSRTDEQNTGGGGRDTLSSIENVQGSGYDDTLTGSIGNNQLNGNAGNDTLSGRDGTDRLFGGGGQDILTGGLGKDLLVGGGGRDTFVFGIGDSNGADADTISDFDTANEKISLSDFATAFGGALSFIGTDAFSGDGGEVRFRVVGTDTKVFVDLDGDKAADLTIVCTGTITFEANDFVLV